MTYYLHYYSDNIILSILSSSVNSDIKSNIYIYIYSLVVLLCSDNLSTSVMISIPIIRDMYRWLSSTLVTIVNNSNAHDGRSLLLGDD